LNSGQPVTGTVNHTAPTVADILGAADGGGVEKSYGIVKSVSGRAARRLDMKLASSSEFGKKLGGIQDLTSDPVAVGAAHSTVTHTFKRERER